MKNLLLLLAVFTLIFLNCKKDESPEVQELFKIEGKWILEDYPNTMLIFEDGLRYTVYCETEDCDWGSKTTTDAIPNPEVYTFSEGTLNFDLGFGHLWEEDMAFVCNGQVIRYDCNCNGYQEYIRWYRPGCDISSCD